MVFYVLEHIEIIMSGSSQFYQPKTERLKPLLLESSLKQKTFSCPVGQILEKNYIFGFL
jgi:hypothetical protein